MRRVLTSARCAKDGELQERAMSVHQLCKREVVTIDANAPVRAAAQVMCDQHVGALVVTQHPPHQRRKMVGLVTDRDLVVGALAHHATPADVAVGEVMSRQAIGVPASASLGDSAATMREEGVRRLLVVDEGSRLLGVVTLDDVIEALAAEMADVTQALRTGLARERGAERTSQASQEDDGQLLLPRESLAARWRQITV
jgi:CBS-domain-containing membrane protein